MAIDYVKYYLTSPDDILEKKIIMPRDTDYPIKITARDYDPANPNIKTPYDFTGDTIQLDIFESEYAAQTTQPLITLDNTHWTITQDADGVNAGVSNVVTMNLLWTDVSTLSSLVDYWYRIYDTDSLGLHYTIMRGILVKDSK